MVSGRDESAVVGHFSALGTVKTNRGDSRSHNRSCMPPCGTYSVRPTIAHCTSTDGSTENPQSARCRMIQFGSMSNSSTRQLRKTRASLFRSYSPSQTCRNLSGSRRLSYSASARSVGEKRVVEVIDSTTIAPGAETHRIAAGLPGLPGDLGFQRTTVLNSSCGWSDAKSSCCVTEALRPSTHARSNPSGDLIESAV